MITSTADGLQMWVQVDMQLLLTRVYCNKLKLTSLNGLIDNILTANKERLNFVFNKKENKGEFSGPFCPLLACF